MQPGPNGGEHRSTRLLRLYYFPVASVLLLLLTLIGFSDNLVTDVGQPSNSDPKFIIHGLLCGAWMILLAVQASLVSAGNVRLHRKFGIAGVLIAIGVTVSTVWVFIAVWKGWGAMTPEVKANRLLLPSYSLFVALAFLRRRRPDWHRRLIYVGTLFMLEPVLARAYDPLLYPFEGWFTDRQADLAFLPWLFLVWLAFFLSLFLYDARVARRIHPVTIGGLLWFGAISGIVLIV
jgi:hypothetical protein